MTLINMDIIINANDAPNGVISLIIN